jgi:hypothetical protein
MCVDHVCTGVNWFFLDCAHSNGVNQIIVRLICTFQRFVNFSCFQFIGQFFLLLWLHFSLTFFKV